MAPCLRTRRLRMPPHNQHPMITRSKKKAHMMAAYTPIKLPYFAPTPTPLPTYEAIVILANQASSELSVQKPGRHIIKIGKFVVKYGKQVDFIEGENMLLVRQHTSIPIPTLYAMYQHEASGNKVIIMEYVVGDVLSDCYNKLDTESKASIGARLRSQLSELREIPSPGFYGVLGGRPYLEQSWLFKERVGPFDSAGAFLDAYFNAQFSEAAKSVHPQISDLKTQFIELSRNYSTPVFTHGDLQGQNIILRKDGSLCLIDWESASYCPAYFEFFIYGTYAMASSGLSESDEHHVLEYSKMAELIIKVWNTYIALNDRHKAVGENVHTSN
ncbi:kinase-like domain-containing protein [Xylariaceae sp. FL1651]|nr:kinase-like domain-containing protein [Xylariaceae sp. FL1651]